MGKEIQRDYQAMSDTLERVLHKYHEIENRERCYGNDLLLTGAEIHLIDEIGRNPCIGIKGISVHKGVTVGAVSQMVKKLVGKELITKKTSRESEAKVELSLTEKGKVCFEGHNAYHKIANQKWYALLNQLNHEDFDKVNTLLNQWDQLLGEL